ncbi:isoprenylcysteine carboxylmethyltransferase family protein [Aureimonas fodinaquatilis]|uniref:Isoprenylcysteine carboxylmethyltransferase family protein n=1 Tax=Aureimonas fodinaquatilis TaxID=2565783 RepID=A0A5B0E062_9HYPH|nr:isoprenylcysteine carboxylmethyltransferase family protein [Aureimonas fodinaquatilis]KAA0971682.1 isoprenylcysteine carboxylmethyltransferase family protein [Aureimonas fodinaquatilis]
MIAVFQQRKRIQFLWLISPLAVFLALYSRSAWPAGSVTADLLRFSGLVLILLCIAGRCWASLYVGGRKNRHLVTSGPYAHSRNPLYLFSAFGLAGVGLLYGSLLLSFLLFALAYAVFRFVIAREEVALQAIFGTEYLYYQTAVPRFFPRILPEAQRTTQVDLVEFSPPALRRTAIDASYFLMALPAINVIQRLQSAQIIQPLFAFY